MQRKTLVMGLLLCVSIFMAGVTDLIGANNLLAPYETGEREFRRVEISDKIVFFHQRMVGEAIVEKGSIVYQFDRNTKELLNKKVRWRGEIPEPPTYEFPVITKKESEAMVDGEVVSRQLYIISPESDIFPIEPTPTNPCWVVTSVQEGNTIITIIDAVTGERLGYGIPPPQVKGFSFSGPYNNNPCTSGWTTWYNNARDWFETMGYPTESVLWPTEETIKSHIQSAETVMFYEIAHGGSTSFASGCIGDTTYEYTTATEVENWIADYKKMPFTFIASCDGMCSTGPGTFSYEFRKGSNDDTATIGYCSMSRSQCWNPGTCWSVSVDWQTALFKYMSYGWPIEAAYNQAMADYPQCWPSEGACMRFAGDPYLVLASIGANINLISPNGGEELFVGDNFEITWTSEENIENVKIEYLNNNGNDWIEIVANTENDGFHNWEVPCDISAECLIRISDIDSTESDISGDFFSIIDNDTDSDGTPNCIDNCPNDPNKVEPGICDCGIVDTDTDLDGTPDCNDNCPNDPGKIEQGICGCGTSDIDSDEDGTPNCNDNCDNDPNKTEPGICGCGIADTDTDLDGTPDCNDNCPNDPNKTQPGVCGCGVSDVDTDSDGTLDCNDNCPNDSQKTQPGVCGCGIKDTDADLDGTPDCIDNCPNDPNKTGPGICGCGIADTDSDGDGIPDCNDDCDNLIDSDGDGTSDCDDLCPNDPKKTQPGTCGCGIVDNDSDGDGTFDCQDTNDDNDGLPDGEEQGPDGNDPNYDGNNDGTADYLQDNVASFHTYDDQNYVTMESPAGTSISNCNAADNPSKTNAPSNVEFSYGFFGFTIDGVGIGGATTVTLHLPVGETISTYYKYGPTPDNTTKHWYEFLYDGQTGAEISGKVITLHFVDGMRGDDDLMANSTVTDVGAPAVAVKTSGGEPPPVTTNSGGGGGCFIATAAYGSLMERHVRILRDFRDSFLLGNTVGNSFVHLYYTYSPPIADFIAEHDSLRAMVRISLLPVVGVCWVTLKLDPPATVTLLLFLGISLIGITGIMRKFKK